MLLEAQLEKEADNHGATEEMEQVQYRNLKKRKRVTRGFMRGSLKHLSDISLPCVVLYVQLKLQLSECQSQLDLAQKESQAQKEELVQVTLLTEPALMSLT